MGYRYNPFSGEFDRVDSGGTPPLINSFPITPYVVGPVGQAGYQTIQDAINAATASGESSNVIWVQPGTYTEDLSITSTITFMSIDGAATIVGIHSPPSTGTVNFDGFVLVSATDILNSSAAGTTVFNVNNCFIVITDGYIFNLPNWTGELLMDNCGEASTEDGVVNNITGSSTIKFLNVEMGAGSKTMELNGDVAGFLRFDTVNVNCPVNMVGDGDLFMQNGVKFANTVTIGGTLSGFAIDTNFRGGSSQALTYNSSGDFSLSNGEVQSTNNPAIGGTGSGTLTLTSVAFPDDNNLAGTLTVAGGNQYSATYKSDYTDGGVILGQGALTNMVATSAGTNGQLLIGGTAVDPAFASLTSTGATVTFTAGINSLNLEATGGVATTYTTDSGNATPAANILNVLGGGSTTTTGAGNTVTVVLTGMTNHSVLVGAGTTTITKVGPDAATGIPLISQGASADPIFGTAVVAGGGTGATTLTDGGILLGSGTGAITATAQPASGELLIGSVGVDPVLATLTAGSGITITEGAGSITIASNNAGMIWTDVTGTTQAMAVDNGYSANNAGLVTLTLPAVAVVGDIVRVDGAGAGGWLIAQNAGQTVRMLGQSTTTGVGGSLASTTQYDCVSYRCIIANTDWVVESVMGNLTVV